MGMRGQGMGWGGERRGVGWSGVEWRREEGRGVEGRREEGRGGEGRREEGSYHVKRRGVLPEKFNVEHCGWLRGKTFIVQERMTPRETIG